MGGLDWTDPWVIGTLAVVGGVLALVGIVFAARPQRRVQAVAVVAGFLGVAALAAAAGICIHALAELRKPPARGPQPAAALSSQEVLERFRQADPAGRLGMVRRLPEGEQGWHTVERGDVTPTVVERGTVEPVTATDVVCQVHPREGAKFPTTIKWVIDDGSVVKKGQLLALLDDAPLREQLKEAKAALERAREALTQGEKDRAAGREAVGEGNPVGKARRADVAAAAKRVKDLEEDLARCKLVAPHGGLVVYYVPEVARFPVGAIDTVVAEGEPVRQGQKLMRVADLSKLQVRTRVHEALVSRVREGQEALVRVDAFPGRKLSGRVKDVAKVASQQDFLTADVKVYPTTVSLEGDVAGLKPGMSAEVTVVTGQHKGVLRLPVQAVLRAGGARWVCYVRAGNGVDEREVKPGASDGVFVEVREGLTEGDQVLLDPRALAARLAELPGPQARGPSARDVVVQSVRLLPTGPQAHRAMTANYGLTARDLAQLAALPGVTRVVPVRSFPQELRHRERRHAGRVIATTPEYEGSEGLLLAAGRFFTDEEEEGQANVAVLGSAAAERLFPDGAALGQSVTVGRHLFVVVGVLRGGEDGPYAKSGDVYLPLRTCQARFGQAIVLRQRGALRREQMELTQVTLTLARAEQVAPTVEAARALLHAAHPKKDWEVLPGVAD